MSQANEADHEAECSQVPTEYYDGSQEEPAGTRTPRPPPIMITRADEDVAATGETGLTPAFESFRWAGVSFNSAVRHASADQRNVADPLENPFPSFSELDEPGANLEYFLVLLGHYEAPEVMWLDTISWQDDLYPRIQGAKRMKCVQTAWPDDRGDGIKRDDVRFKAWYLPTSEDNHNLHEPNTALEGTSGPVYIAKLSMNDEIVPLDVLSWRDNQPILSWYANQIEAGGGLQAPEFTQNTLAPPTPTMKRGRSPSPCSQESTSTVDDRKYRNKRPFDREMHKECTEGIPEETRN